MTQTTQSTQTDEESSIPREGEVFQLWTRLKQLGFVTAAKSLKEDAIGECAGLLLLLDNLTTRLTGIRTDEAITRFRLRDERLREGLKQIFSDRSEQLVAHLIRQQAARLCNPSETSAPTVDSHGLPPTPSDLIASR